MALLLLFCLFSPYYVHITTTSPFYECTYLYMLIICIHVPQYAQHKILNSPYLGHPSATYTAFALALVSLSQLNSPLLWSFSPSDILGISNSLLRPNSLVCHTKLSESQIFAGFGCAFITFVL